MRKLRRVFLFLSLVFLIVGVLQCFKWVKWTSEISYFALLLNLLPFVMFGGFYLILRKWKKTMWLHASAVVLCICALAFSARLVVRLESFIRARAEVTNIKKYEGILNEYWTEEHMGYRGMVSHFPRPIPKGAKNVVFSFQPWFMQGGGHIQLRYSTDPKTIRALYEEFSQRKTKSFFGGNRNDHMNVEEGMPTTFFYTNHTDDNEFPDDYEIMIFDEVLKDRPEGFYWNHGRSRGVAISRERNEIVYWAEVW